MVRRHGNYCFNSNETPRLMNLLEKFTTLRLEPTESMVDYLTRAEFVSKQLEHAGEKVSENMLTSIVHKGLPSDYDYFKTVPDFSKNRASFAEVKKVLKNFESSRNLQTAAAVKIMLCYPKKLLRKVPRVNLKSSPGSVCVAVKVDINKPLVEYPSETFAGVLAMNRINVSRKTLF